MINNNIGVTTPHLIQEQEETQEFTLDAVTAENAHEVQQTAVVRLHLFVTGEVHRLLRPVYEAAADVLLGTDEGAAVDTILGSRARKAALDAWDEFVQLYAEMIGRGMRYGAAIPFGTLAVMHRDLVLPVVAPAETAVEELGRYPGAIITEQEHVAGGVFEPQLQQVVAAAQRRVLDDGLQLSNRIWRFDQNSRQGIDRVILQAIDEGKSAWDTAVLLEKYLGANADCPRWTEDRLYGLTKTQIAQRDRQGLYTGDDCRGQGVSYNALRLARNEIQAVHQMATDRIFKEMPWVEEEKILLSPAHPEPDICDDVVGGGENNDGVYPKGEISLPLHVHCLCYKQAVLMDSDEFVAKLRGWMTNTQSWPAMDGYKTTIGGDMTTDLTSSGIGLSMAYWAFADHFTLNETFWRIALGQ